MMAIWLLEPFPKVLGGPGCMGGSTVMATECVARVDDSILRHEWIATVLNYPALLVS